jgi:hypothetical protein
MKYAIKAVPLALLLLLFGKTDTEAQAGPLWWGMTYQTSLSVGDTKNFTDQFSWRNIGVEGKSMITPNLSVGVFAGWNVFNEEVEGTVSIGSVDASGYQSRFVNAIPFLATAHYYFGDRSRPRLFLGTGVGTYWIENKLELGLTAITLDNWHFGMAPEVGFSIPTQGNSEAYFSAKYNYAFESGGITHSYLTFGIGFGTGF